MQRDTYRGDVGRKTRTRVERRPQLGEEEKQRRKSQIPQEEKLGGRSGRLEKTCNRKTTREGGLTAGRKPRTCETRTNQSLRILEEKMNSTRLHSLSCGTLAGEMALGGFGLQRWRARKQIKDGEKPGGDFSKAGVI